MPIATDKTDATPSVSDHAAHHNALGVAANDHETRLVVLEDSSAPTLVLPWAPDADYVAGQPATFQGVIWIASSNHTSGATFDGVTHWRGIGSSQRTAWELLKLKADGHSIPAGSGTPWGKPSGYVSRLTQRLNLLAIDNHAVSGSTSAAIAGSQTYSDGYGDGTGNNPNGWAYLWDGLVNDAGSTSAKAQAKFAGSLAFSALSIRFLTAVTGLTLTGTWADAGSGGNTIPGVVPKVTTTLNDTAKVTGLTGGRKAMLCLIGIDDATETPGGAAYSVSVGSDSSGPTVVATGTTSNKCEKNGDTSGRCPLVIVVDIPAGANGYATIKKTDASGTQLAISPANSHKVLGTPGAVDAPLGVFVKQPHVTAFLPDASIDLYNGLLVSTLTGLGGFGIDLFVAAPALYGFDAAIHTLDTLHPNWLGAEVYDLAIAGEVYLIAPGD